VLSITGGFSAGRAGCGFRRVRLVDFLGATVPYHQRIEVSRYRVSSETSFDSKQPKMKPKLVSALSETKHLFWLVRFFTETASFCVSIELKQRKANRNKQKRKLCMIPKCVPTKFFRILTILMLSI